MCLTQRFRNDKQTESAMCFAAIWIGSCKQHQHVGTGCKGAPGFHTINDVTLDSCFVCALHCHGGEIGDIAAVVRFGYCNRSHHFGGCKLWQPLLLLCFGPTIHQRTRENFWASNQRTANAKRRTRQLFCSDAVGHVFAIATFAEATVFRRN